MDPIPLLLSWLAFPPQIPLLTPSLSSTNSTPSASSPLLAAARTGTVTPRNCCTGVGLVTRASPVDVQSFSQSTHVSQSQSTLLIPNQVYHLPLVPCSHAHLASLPP